MMNDVFSNNYDGVRYNVISPNHALLQLPLSRILMESHTCNSLYLSLFCHVVYEISNESSKERGVTPIMRLIGGKLHISNDFYHLCFSR